MKTAIDVTKIPATVRGRSFARTAPDGTLDGSGDHGVYSNDVRMIRRAEAFGAGREYPVIPTIAVDADGAALRYVVPAVQPGDGVLLIAEVDGADTFGIRRMQTDTNASSGTDGLGLGEARPEARVVLEAWCEGAELEHRDGVALAQAPIPADGTPRTAAWRWRRSADEQGTGEIVVELRIGWSTLSNEAPAAPRSFAELETGHHVETGFWLGERPTFEGGPSSVRRVMERSLVDLASLRIDGDDGVLLAAGVPWFLTVFGRDAIVSAWMALPVDPKLAAATLRHLARHQATSYDTSIDAEPGKVMHEERTGVAARRWHQRYYGSIDATPLFVQLLAEHASWTEDDRLARELEESARAAVGWITARLDEDELGLLGFSRRAERGLDVQSWKDSPDSQRDRSGRVASGRIRPIEVQGYAVGALNAAADLAERVWGDTASARGWRDAATDLSRRIQAHYEVAVPRSLMQEGDPRSGGFLAMAIDEAGMPLDALTSNPGHLLWSDAIPDPGVAQRTARQLADPALFSGWGVRTMSTLDDGYSARSYHCGSVWPHDTAICIAGMAPIAPALAATVAQGLFEAGAATHDAHLPELVAGTPRSDLDRRPEEPDGTCTPQAWAAAAPLLVVRSLLGLQTRAGELCTTIDEAPELLHGTAWRGVYAAGRRWDVVVDDLGNVAITPRD